MQQRSHREEKFSEGERAFIAEQTKLRMGRFFDPKGRSRQSSMTLDFGALKVDRDLVIFRVRNATVDILFQFDGDNARCDKFIEYIRANHLDCDSEYVADFDDRIPAVYEPFESAGVPIFSKNRPVDSNSPVILWTHNGYRIVRQRSIAGKFGAVAWGAKIPELIWRGRPRGSLRVSDGRYIVAPRIYEATLAPKDNPEHILQDLKHLDFKQIADEKLIRFRLIARFSDVFNVRFVDFGEKQLNDQPGLKAFSAYAREHYRFDAAMGIDELIRYKYMLVLGGNDAGTQINWALSANSVILMPPIRFHSTTTLGLSEWVHYVPVRYDLSDLEEKMNWCRRNDDECRAIAKNAKAYVANFRNAVEDEINYQVIARYNCPPGR